jgi:hypothetical protein
MQSYHNLEDLDDDIEEQSSDENIPYVYDVELPQVLGPGTFEIEFLEHRNNPIYTTSNDEGIGTLLNLSPIAISAEIYGMFRDISPPSVRRWFRNHHDPRFLAHLFEIYFYWIHPSYEIFSRDQFLADFRTGTAKTCSRILANAVASFACLYSDRALALALPDDSSTAGDQFFAEAARILQHSGKEDPTAAQALVVMSSRELSCGRILSSNVYAEKCRGGNLTANSLTSS